MRKRTLVFILIFGFICLYTNYGHSEDAEKPTNPSAEFTKSLLKSFSLAAEETTKEANVDISGHISVWQRFLTTDEDRLPLNVSGLSAGRAAEFATVSTSAGAGFGMRGFLNDKSSFNLSGKFYHKDELAYSADLDLGRIVRTETQVNRFLHRLNHDPLTNVDPDPHAQEEFVFVDSNPDDIYSTTRTQVTNKTDLVLPFIPNLKIKSQVRYVHEKGLQQARTFEMCRECHVEAQTQTIDQRTRDFILGAEFNVKGIVISYSHLGRTFENKANPVYHEYTNPYGSLLYSGKQEFAHIPDSEKKADTVKAKIDALKNTSLYGSYTIANVKSKHNDGKADIKNFLSRFRIIFAKGLNLTFRYISNKYENKMNPDLTYDTSTLNANHLSKDGYTIGGDASFRIPKQRIHLRAGFDYNSLKRNFSWGTDVDDEVKDITEKYLKETKTTTFRTSATFYPSSKIKGFLRYKLKSIDNPLGVPHLAEENPVDPTTERFMSNLYSNINLLSAGLSVSPADRLSISANYLYNSSKNDNLNSSQTRNNLIFSLWYAVSNKVSFTASYTYMNDETINSLIYGTAYEYKDERIAYEDKDVPYSRKSNVFLLALDFRPSDDFSIYGDMSIVTGKADWESTGFHPTADTADIAGLSDQDLTHYRASAGVSYYFMKNASVFGKWKYEDYKDKAYIVHGEGGYSDSGRYHILYLGVGYRF